MSAGSPNVEAGAWDSKYRADLAYGEQGSIAPDDVDGYIADNQLIAERLDDTTVDGRSTVVYNLRLDPDVEGSLFEEGRATLVYSMAEPSFDAAAAGHPSRATAPGLSGRLWLVDVDRFAPIAIIAAAGPGSEDFLDEFEATILPTITFGPDGPSKPLE